MSSVKITRRKFAAAAASMMASACLPFPDDAFGSEKSQEPQARALPVARNAYALDLSRSPYAMLRTLPLNAVTVTSGFWAQRIAANLSGCIPEVYQQEGENDRVLNFQRMHDVDHANLSTNIHSLRHGADSEVYKWLEGASWSLTTPNQALQAKAMQVVRAVVGAQEPSGYLDTYFVGERIPERMLPDTQIVGHEIYCMGHLIQAGIALYRVTSDRTLLDAGLRFVNDYVLAGFGPEPDKKPLMSGHPGPEMTLVELYRETSDPRYLHLAEYLLHGDKRIPVRPDQASYTFAGTPFTDRTIMEGHAVRAVYACCGATDYALETGDPPYIKTLGRLWDDMTERQMYVTGAVGATMHNEAFGGDYVLPNQGSYCESCANIGVAQWALRMLALTGEAKYGDVMERVLYNGVNSGMALDGRSFNYRNPLLYTPEVDPKVRRPFWYVNCCPPNLARIFGSLQSYFYSTSKEGVYVHLYDNSELDWHLQDGTPLKMTQSTGYPWSGTVDLIIQPLKPAEFTLFLRIPGWAGGSSATVNGASVELVKPGEYLAIRRTWSSRDKVELTLDMTSRLVAANPKIEATRRRVAVQRGPLIYCMEALDQPDAPSLDHFALKLDPDADTQFRERHDPEVLGGIVAITAPGVLYQDKILAKDDSPYTPLELSARKPESLTLQLIPYYAFANRAESAMQVWLPYAEL